MVANQLNVTESQRQTLQAAIDANKSASARNRLGQFATPNALAVEIARFVCPLVNPRCGGIRFADPSIGTGSFFSAALAALGPNRIESAIGIELDPAFADVARELWSGAGLEII